MTDQSLIARRFAGNDNVLCSFKCPFNRIIDNYTGFCLLFKNLLKYEETGNNDLCYRCKDCKLK